MRRVLVVVLVLALARSGAAVTLSFDLLAWDDSRATPGLPSAVGRKPSPPFPTEGDWLLFTADDEQLPATYNPHGALSHNLADITGFAGSGFNMAPSLSGAGAIVLELSPSGCASWTVQVIHLYYQGQATPIATMNQILVTPDSPAAQNPAYHVDGLGNEGTWASSSESHWALTCELDFFFATNVDGDGSSTDVDATFNDKVQTGYLIPVDHLTPDGMVDVDLDDPAGFYDGDFEQYLLAEIAPRLPSDATYLLITQMAKTNPGYAEPGLPITTSSLIGNTTLAYTTQTVPALPRADFDCDGDVDEDDLTVFESCATGPAIPHNGSETCQQADFDIDTDVDQVDFAGFQRCYSGKDNLADPDCAD